MHSRHSSAQTPSCPNETKARGWHPHTPVNAFPTGVKILDRPNWSLDRLTLTYECISPWENVTTPPNLGSKVSQNRRSETHLNRVSYWIFSWGGGGGGGGGERMARTKKFKVPRPLLRCHAHIVLMVPF